MERRVPIKRDGETCHVVALTADRDPSHPLFTRNGRPVQDYRAAWAKLTEGLKTGAADTLRSTTSADPRSLAANKGIGAEKAGTHLTSDVFNRYISQSAEEEQETAATIEA
jgi:hypothetical protein